MIISKINNKKDTPYDRNVDTLLSVAEHRYSSKLLSIDYRVLCKNIVKVTVTVSLLFSTLIFFT